VNHRQFLLAIAAAAALASACSGNGMPPPNPGPGPGPSPGPTTAVFVGAGDIGMCGREAPFATARLLDSIEGTVFTAGDNAYPSGSMRNFLDCYEPSWGRHKERTFPVPGNHEYETPNASAYFEYFGDNAGSSIQGYYSYEVGSWHVLALNSNIPAGVGSAQYAFVTRDLAAHPVPCTIAIWHHPVFSSGPNGNAPIMRDIYRALYDANADVVINGHEHWYERFAPQDAEGRLDTARGVRTFIVGTGGADQTGLVRQQPNSEFQLQAFGVLKLTLNQGSYDWTFLRTNGAIGDFNTGRCH
jgi:hypothetical protein